MTAHHQGFIDSFRSLAEDVYETAREKGWWNDRLALIAAAEQISSELGRYARLVVEGNSLMLKTSELAEALEALRHGNPPDDKIPEFSGVEAELADTVIRIMDTAHAGGYRVAEAIVAKMAMNKTRAHMHGGKLC